MKLELTESAHEDLEGIWEFTSRRSDSEDTATRLIDELINRLRTIVTFPGAGRRRSELGPDIRSFPIHDNYIAYFSEQPARVLILRILDGRRNITAITPMPSRDAIDQARIIVAERVAGAVASSSAQKKQLFESLEIWKQRIAFLASDIQNSHAIARQRLASHQITQAELAHLDENDPRFTSASAALMCEMAETNAMVMHIRQTVEISTTSVHAVQEVLYSIAKKCGTKLPSQG